MSTARQPPRSGRQGHRRGPSTSCGVPRRASSCSSTTVSGTGTGSEIDLPTELFDEQMAWLAQHRRPVSLDEAVELLEARRRPAGPPPVVVTFDDGTADFVDHAVPVLDRHRVPATLYLATDFAERQRTFPRTAPRSPGRHWPSASTTGLVTSAPTPTPTPCSTGCPTARWPTSSTGPSS